MSHPFDNLHTFIAALERQGDMQRVTAEVNPVYEMAEIAGRQVKAEAPVLFFERVTGSPHPVVLNVLASDRRIELALGRHPQQVGAELKTLLEAVQPPTLESLWSIRGSTSRVLSMRPKRVVAAPVQSTQLTPDLRTLPIMHCWPGDAGRFVTFGLVMTVDPVTGGRNTGVYRMQLAGTDRLGMHWQIQKGGGFHYHHAEQLHQPLETAVVIGADPVTLIAAVSPLPEGIDELAFAGFLRGKPVPMVRGKHK
jgi:4-hydroxybenzoate decarboxylase subunit C